MVLKLLTGAYRAVVYTAQEVVWGFEDKSPREDQLRDCLRRLGVSTTYLNLYLDRTGVSREAGRFPDLFQTNDSLIGRMASDYLELSSFPHNRVFTPEEKREFIALGVVEGLKK